MFKKLCAFLGFLLFFSWGGPLICIGSPYNVRLEKKSYPTTVIFKKNEIKGNYYCPEPDEGKPLIVAVHGTSYGKWMWDVPGYSWAKYFTGELGYPLLAIDRIGCGDSSHPNGDLLTPCYQLNTLKDCLRQVKKEHTNRKIIWAGHSMGGQYGNLIAAETDLIDGLIIMGLFHCKVSGLGPPVSAFLADDYVIWPPEGRGEALYHADGADPAVIAYDNNHAHAIPRGTAFEALGLDKFVLDKIELPVFWAAGEYDKMWESIDMVSEVSLYEHADVQSYLQENAGHMNILHLNNQLVLDEIRAWLGTNY